MCNSNQQPQCVYVCTDCNTPCTRSVPPCQPHEEEEEPYLEKLQYVFTVPSSRLYLCTLPTAPVSESFGLRHVSLPAWPTQSPEIDARAVVTE